MEDYFDNFYEGITSWELIKEMNELDLVLDDEFCNESQKADSSVQLLPRQDVILYGTIPKMEQRIYSKCKECKLVFNPRDILSHKTCSGRAHSSSIPQNFKNKVKSKGSSSKKSHSSLPPPPIFKKPPLPVSAAPSPVVSESKSPSKISSKVPKISTVSSTSSTHTVTSSSKSETRVSSVSSHTSKSNSVHSPKSPSKSTTSAHSPKSSSKTATSTESTASHSGHSSSSSSSSSSRYKKSRKSKSNTKITKEFDPDVHCGVIEGNRGPCTRSITCSNHRCLLPPIPVTKSLIRIR